MSAAPTTPRLDWKRPPNSEHDRINRVLIVEDDVAQRATLADILEHEGFHPIAVANASEALNQVSQESFGVAILDYRLPGTTGIQLLERIKSMNGEVRVIIHTGYGSFDSAKDAINLGAFAYVEKGKDPGELVRHVHRAVRSHYQEYAGALESTVEARTNSLRESDERYRTLIETSPDGIAILDNQQIVFANRACAALLGRRTPDEIIGHNVDTLIPEAHRSEAAVRLGTILESDLPQIIGEFRIRTPDRRRLDVEIRGVQVPFEGRRSIQLICRDVTEQKKAEKQRELIDANLRETQKMEAAGQLAAGIAHDFNNLLTVILGNTELLKDRMAKGHIPHEVNRPLVEQIDQAGNRAAALTSRLLTFSRRQPVKLHRVDLNRVVADLDELLRGVLGETVQYTKSTEEALPPILADVSQLEQIIMNFALNARDAMPYGGCFKIETRRVMADTGLIEAHPRLLPREYVVLSTSDTGTGITAETLEHIFEPFFTTKPAGKGTGLGLATVYGIVRQAGGTVDVSSQIGSGTQFVVYWPTTTGEYHESAPAQAPKQGGSTGTVLLCEDDPGVLEVTSQMLTDEGFSVLPAPNGRLAIEIATNHPGPIDLLITDLLMPGMQGDAMAARFRELRKESGILFMTGCATNPESDGQNALGELDVLKKPFKKVELLDMIRAAISKAGG